MFEKSTTQEKASGIFYFSNAFIFRWFSVMLCFFPHELFQCSGSKTLKTKHWLLSWPRFSFTRLVPWHWHIVKKAIQPTATPSQILPFTLSQPLLNFQWMQYLDCNTPFLIFSNPKWWELQNSGIIVYSTTAIQRPRSSHPGVCNLMDP